MAKNGVTEFVQGLNDDPNTWNVPQALEYLEASTTAQRNAYIVTNGNWSEGEVRRVAAGIIRTAHNIPALLDASSVGQVGQYNVLNRPAFAAAFNAASNVVQSVSQTLPGPNASPPARVVPASGARMNANIAAVAASNAVSPVPAQAASAATQIRLMNSRVDPLRHPAEPAGEVAEDEKEPKVKESKKEEPKEEDHTDEDAGGEGGAGDIGNGVGGLSLK